MLERWECFLRTYYDVQNSVPKLIGKETQKIIDAMKSVSVKDITFSKWRRRRKIRIGDN